MDETATGFIDIQFGLIAIFILLLSAATAGIGNLSNQLKGVEGGMSGIINLLLCDNLTAGSKECGAGDHNRFSGQNQDFDIELSRPGHEMVLVLGMTDKDWNGIPATARNDIGLFASGQIYPPGSLDYRPDALTEIRDRLSTTLVCFAPLAREAVNGRALARNAFTNCPAVLAELPGSESTAAPGIDLLQIEGHGDWREAGTTDAGVALGRAQTVLLALLFNQVPTSSDPVVDWIKRSTSSNDDSKNFNWVAYQLDQIMSMNGNQRDALSTLFWLAPLGARIEEECRAGRHYNRTLPDWCWALVNPMPAPRIGNEDFTSRLPKLFAMTSYGRFSLRYGVPGEINPRDRRVEFRLRGSIIPAAIHELYEETGNTRLFRLYSTDAVMALHQCDETRESNQTCLDALDRLTIPD